MPSSNTWCRHFCFLGVKIAGVFYISFHVKHKNAYFLGVFVLVFYSWRADYNITSENYYCDMSKIISFYKIFSLFE